MNRLKNLSRMAQYRATREPAIIRPWVPMMIETMERFIDAFAPDKRKVRKQFRKLKRNGAGEVVRWYREVT